MTTNDLHVQTKTPSATIASIASGDSADSQSWYGDAVEGMYEKIGKHHHAVSGHVFVESTSDAEPSESEFGFEVTSNLPNLRPDDLEVTVSGQWLTVAGRNEVDDETGESTMDDFYQSFWLSPKLDTDRVQALLRDGVLNIRIPWRDDALSSTDAPLIASGFDD